jgi:hypothetical protein
VAKKLDEWWTSCIGIGGYVAYGKVAKKLEGWVGKLQRDGWVGFTEGWVSKNLEQEVR